jgi:hypothetical protein
VTGGDLFGSREHLKNNYAYRMAAAVLGIWGQFDSGGDVSVLPRGCSRPTAGWLKLAATDGVTVRFMPLFDAFDMAGAKHE